MPGEMTIGEFRRLLEDGSVESTDRALAALIRGIGARCDVEAAHWKADIILLDVARRAGFEETAEAFEELPKWYA